VIEAGEQLVPDVEGMAIYRRGAQAWLVVSSQGSNSFAVYALEPGYPLVGDFRVTADLAAGIDGVSETDGLDVTSAALPGYPDGLLVLQDGRNRLPDAPQDFKLVDWRAVAAVLGLAPAGAQGER
jgi:3-phytase